ncbi:hypothetical protein NPIL_231621 [Nephila pilipes]|uniref:Uncharacterized protein n=1 Tax=Nephila pilipes TaxID=299642 RepID=A0A8X6QPH0_NEPPI|nr:hypothetical protein NPIL_231621 [Nephila pilipes]
MIAFVIARSSSHLCTWDILSFRSESSGCPLFSTASFSSSTVANNEQLSHCSDKGCGRCAYLTNLLNTGLQYSLLKVCQLFVLSSDSYMRHL